MPNKVTLKNSSRSIPVAISLFSHSNEKIILDLKDKMINPSMTENVIVKGGVKKLVVKKEHGVTIWEGMVPTYGGHDIVVFPEKAEVRYNDDLLVNTLNTAPAGPASESDTKWNNISIGFLFFMVFIAAFLLIYMGYAYMFKK